MSINPKDIDVAKLKEKIVTVDRFVKICSAFPDRGFDEKTLRDALKDLPHGSFLGIHSTDHGKTYKRLHLKKIWIRPYTLSYRTTKTEDAKARTGRELLIANFKLPKVKI